MDRDGFSSGGDEFAVLLLGTAGEVIEQEQEVELLSALHQLENGTLRVALGSACFPAEGTDVATLLRLADQRLYRHKIRSRVTLT